MKKNAEPFSACQTEINVNELRFFVKYKNGENEHFATFF